MLVFVNGIRIHCLPNTRPDFFKMSSFPQYKYTYFAWFCSPPFKKKWTEYRVQSRVWNPVKLIVSLKMCCLNLFKSPITEKILSCV